jgi:hypothetical protein
MANYCRAVIKSPRGTVTILERSKWSKNHLMPLSLL